MHLAGASNEAVFQERAPGGCEERASSARDETRFACQSTRAGIHVGSRHVRSDRANGERIGNRYFRPRRRTWLNANQSGIVRTACRLAVGQDNRESQSVSLPRWNGASGTGPGASTKGSLIAANGGGTDVAGRAPVGELRGHGREGGDFAGRLRSSNSTSTRFTQRRPSQKKGEMKSRRA